MLASPCHGRAEQSRRIEEQNNEHVRVEEGWGVDRSKYYDQRGAGKMLCGGEKKQERVERTTRRRRQKADEEHCTATLLDCRYP